MRTLLFLIPMVFSTAAHSADWAADWLEGSLSGGGPTYYEGASRNYLSVGNISYRANTGVDYPITISPPRLKAAGCGGIDGFLGGISFMDLDMLVEKFEQMIQNGEVIAFQLAVKALSEKLGTTVEGIEAIINKINSVQMDSCAMAKTAVTTIVDDGGLKDAMGNVWEEVSQGQDLSLDGFKNSWERAIANADNDNEPSGTTNMQREINACPAHIKEVLTFEGSALENLADDFGLAGYTDVIRGYTGDLVISHAGPGSLPIVQETAPCADNDLTSADDLVYGTSFAAEEPTIIDLQPICYQNGNRVNLIAFTEQNLNDLSSALKEPDTTIGSFDGLDEWITTAPLPVYGIMQSAVNMGIEQEVTREIQTVVAYAYAFQMFDDLFKTSSRMFTEVSRAVSTNSFDEAQAGSDDIKKCNLKPYMHIIKAYEEFTQKMRTQHRAMRESYALQLERTSSALAMVNRYEQHAKDNEHRSMGQAQ